MSAMILDRFGLGFSVRGDRVLVHYPKRAPDGALGYGAGVEIEPPERWSEPTNAISEERRALIASLRASA